MKCTLGPHPVWAHAVVADFNDHTLPLPLSWAVAMAHVAACPGSWMSVEAAEPAKPQKMFERRAVEPASTLGSAGTPGHSPEGNTDVRLGCVLGRNV